MMTAASFSAVLTDITHSRVGPWDLCLSLHWRGWPKPCPANSFIHTVSTALQRINSKPKKYLNWTILHTINKLFSICTSTCVHIQQYDAI
jgi:acyl carrier protein phosphodiesterase